MIERPNLLPTPSPIESFVVKITARCNLACSYCYEFFAYDQSWRGRRPMMSIETARRVGERIGEHAAAHHLQRVSILLHGGEPTLVGVEHCNAILNEIDSGVASRTALRFGIQTNGLLLDEEWLRLAERWRIDIGVSCDGPPHSADRLRVDHAGHGRGATLERALRLLAGHPAFSGLLASSI